TYLRITARCVRSEFQSVVHTAPLCRGVRDSGGRSPTPTVRDHSGAGPSRPTAPHRPAQLGDRLGCQAEPPGTAWHRLNPIQATRSAPGGDRRDIYIQLSGRFLDRTPPVPAIAISTRSRPLRAAALDRVLISNPLHFVLGERALGAGSQTLSIQQA